MSVKLLLDPPVVVAQAPASVRGWGPYQFCYLETLRDGRIHLRYHIEADSARAYGMPNGHAVSSDNGATWQTIDNPSGDPSLYVPAQGCILPNGDRFTFASPLSRPLEGLKLPKPTEHVKGSYCAYDIFEPAEMSADLRPVWRFCRLPGGSDRWSEEIADVNIPGDVAYTTEGVLPQPQVYRMRTAPDGSLWILHYLWRRVNGKLDPKWRAMFLRSTDGGRHFTLHGEIPYQPDPKADPKADKRDGFSEPDIAFLPDGSIWAVMRTSDGNGIGPMYACRSTDGGRIWPKPAPFDPLGVWPDALTLPCGVTLLAYGRPGLFLRATADPDAKNWSDRFDVITPTGLTDEHVGRDTCAYASLLPLGDREALLAYSDFNVPGPDGTPRKTILARRVRVG